MNLYESCVIEFKRAFLMRVLLKHRGHEQNAAKELGIHRNTLMRQMAICGLSLTIIKGQSRRRKLDEKANNRNRRLDHQAAASYGPHSYRGAHPDGPESAEGTIGVPDGGSAAEASASVRAGARLAAYMGRVAAGTRLSARQKTSVMMALSARVGSR